MPEIKAFRGWRYNKEKNKDLAKVYAPPYDVISKKQQEALYQKNPFNVIRLELGKETPSDNAKNNKYIRAGRILSDWQSSEVLSQEESPALYVHLQDYVEEGKKKSRLGFIAAMKINEKETLKHENTLASPKKDRMALLKEVKTNLSPIFGLFEDPQALINRELKGALRRTPEIDVTTDGVRHRIYLETDPSVILKIKNAMRSKPMFIADGHHRFEVACQYKNWSLSKNKTAAPEASYRYVMTYFADCLNNPFKIFPTHRLVKAPKGMKDPLGALAGLGKLEKVKNLAVVLKALEKYRQDTPKKEYNFGVYTKKDGFYIFTLDSKLARRVKQNPVDSLDVAVLHSALISPVYKIHVIAKSEAIDFTRSAEEAKAKVDAGTFSAAFFLRPTSLKEMLLASKKGLKMPQKSTYFYPKLLTGLVFHSLHD